MVKHRYALAIATLLATLTTNVLAWDHPGHMTTAAIAFAEIEKNRPDLIDKIGMLFLAHPEVAPFWVAAGEAKGNERVRRMFIECARWADDVKFTPNDRPTWHTARWPVLTEDAPPEAKAAAAAREGKPAGQALEAGNLNFAMLSNSESTPAERALSLCWVFHVVGDIHQPMHVSDLYSAQYPTGNPAATLSYVDDPIRDSTIPLHILWDSNTLRKPTLTEVDQAASAYVLANPRSSYAELTAHPISDQNFLEQWAQESHQVAVDWALDIQTVPDPNIGQDSDQLVKAMVNFILNGVSPVDEAPEVPAEYWNDLQTTAQRRITLAGYRIADLVISAADSIEAERAFVGR